MFQISSNSRHEYLPMVKRLLLAYARAEKLSYFDLPLRDDWHLIYNGEILYGCVLLPRIGETYGAVCLLDKAAACRSLNQVDLMELLVATFHKVPAFVDLVPVAMEPLTSLSCNTAGS